MKPLLSLLILTMLAASTLAEGPVRHVVHFKFKKEATPQQIDDLCKEFAALPSKIKEIESFEWGTNSSPEALDKGFKHCWVISFKSAKDRDVYLKHPAHEAFVAIVKPIVEDVIVVDFVPEKKP
jgi:Stress responsive A/B Barrel Domain